MFLSLFQLDDHPGPGTYVSHTPCDKNTPSISKKGTGGFASKVYIPPNIRPPLLQSGFIHTVVCTAS